MNRKQSQAGFTLVELAVVLAVAAVLAVFAVPSLNNLAVKHNLSNAGEKVALALTKAKRMARSENTKVVVAFNQGSNTIQLKTPGGTVLQAIKLNHVNADTTGSVSFNSLGAVNTTASITLVSTKDPSKTTQVNVDSLFGHVKIG
jgi:prepilin-type N-terminal cleavage/methylation domain-containing protein